MKENSLKPFQPKVTSAVIEKPEMKKENKILNFIIGVILFSLYWGAFFSIFYMFIDKLLTDLFNDDYSYAGMGRQYWIILGLVGSFGSIFPIVAPKLFSKIGNRYVGVGILVSFIVLIVFIGIGFSLLLKMFDFSTLISLHSLMY